MSDNYSYHTHLRLRRWWFRGLAWVASTALSALIGPLTTMELFGFGERLLYWGSIIGLAIILGLGVQSVVLRILGPDRLITDLVGGLVLSFVFGPIVWGINLWIYGSDLIAPQWVLYHIGITLAVCLCIAQIRHYMRKEASVAPTMPNLTDAGAVQPSKLPRFIERLHPGLRGPLHSVSADGHYLQVVTATGSARVKLRLGDALAELSAWPGWQIHRSHWVAETALVAIRREGRRYVAELISGRTLPVSQAYLGPLQDAGMLARRPADRGMGTQTRV